MSKMVERVAKAIYEQRNGFGTLPWSRREHIHKAPYIADAKVAIAAMRGPTESMIDAGYNVGYSPDPLPMKLCWDAMIDEALK